MSELKLILDGSLLLFIIMIINCVISRCMIYRATMRMCERKSPTVAKIATVQKPEVSDETRNRKSSQESY